MGLTEPRMGAFVAGVVGLAAGLGFSVLLMLYVGWMTALSGQGGPMSGMWTLPVGALLTGTALALWVRKRRAVRRMAPAKRWILVVAGYVLSLGVSVLFFANVR